MTIKSPNMRASFHHGPWSQTMKDDLFSWSDLMVQLPWFDFFKRSITKLLMSPSLGVNRMWTKRNDHPQNDVCAYFLIYTPKRKTWKNNPILIILLSSSSLPEKFIINYYNNISLPRLPAFLDQSTSFASPTGKTVGRCQLTT